jgi:hypothetical protein
MLSIWRELQTDEMDACYKSLFLPVRRLLASSIGQWQKVTKRIKTVETSLPKLIRYLRVVVVQVLESNGGF